MRRKLTQEKIESELPKLAVVFLSALIAISCFLTMLFAVSLIVLVKLVP